MNRAGREPAEDIKRRLTAACHEVGLCVDHANMQLDHTSRQRIVYVGASVPGWPHATPTVSVSAFVPISGTYPATIDIRCAGTDEDPLLATTHWMRGRGHIPFVRLIGELQDTLVERQQVLDSLRAGESGPFHFAESVWARVDLLDGDLDDLFPHDAS